MENGICTVSEMNIDIPKIAQRVYEQLGSGHTESIYHRAMEIELRHLGIQYEIEKRVLITYNINDIKYTVGEERIDLFLIDHNIIIELKATSASPKEKEFAQLNKYYRELKKMGIICNKGLIINFPQARTYAADDVVDIQEIEWN